MLGLIGQVIALEWIKPWRILVIWDQIVLILYIVLFVIFSLLGPLYCGGTLQLV